MIINCHLAPLSDTPVYGVGRGLRDLRGGLANTTTLSFEPNLSALFSSRLVLSHWISCNGGGS